jgi:hypothetical protein
MEKEAALLWEPAAEQRSSVSGSRNITELPASKPDCNLYAFFARRERNETKCGDGWKGEDMFICRHVSS